MLVLKLTCVMTLFASICLGGCDARIPDVRSNIDGRCQLRTAPLRCSHYRLISKPGFHGFITPESLNETCSKMQDALFCVDKLFIGCLERARIPFDMQKNVLDAVCNERRQEVLYSAECFSSKRVRETIHFSCLSQLTDDKMRRNDPCRLMEMIIVCSADTVRSSIYCSTADAEFMAALVEVYLEPSVGLLCKTHSQSTGQSTKNGKGTTQKAGARNIKEVSTTQKSDFHDEKESPTTQKSTAPTKYTTEKKPLVSGDFPGHKYKNSVPGIHRQLCNTFLALLPSMFLLLVSFFKG